MTGSGREVQKRFRLDKSVELNIVIDVRSK